VVTSHLLTTAVLGFVRSHVTVPPVHA
jgi:hypothetical protein